MPRKRRIFVQDGVYHVYCRVARGEQVFDNTSHADYWVDTVSFATWLHDLTVLAWCLMSNHYHLVIKTHTIPLWRAMAVIQGRVAKQFNRDHRYTGRLWQSRYKARIVQDPVDLDHLFAYVHLNPVAAGIVEDPLDYPQSGHGELLGTAPRLCDVQAALAFFDEDLTTARSVYTNHVRAVTEARWLSTGVRRLPWWQTVQEDDETVPRNLAPRGSTNYLGQPLAPEQHARPELVDVLAMAEAELGLTRGALSGSSRARLLAWYRCLFATFAVSWLGYTSKEVEVIVNKGRSSVSRWVSDGLVLQKSAPEFLDSLNRLASSFARQWPYAEFVLPRTPSQFDRL